MSSDLFPHVAGRLLEGPGPVPHAVRFRRTDPPWTSDWTPLGAEGGLVVMLELSPRKANLFHIEARDHDQRPVPVQPDQIRIVQGLTITDPPLSRSIGVALASDLVHVYLERGTPLPAKRTFVHHTVETVPAGMEGALIRIPIVQGELERAHLCRLVGTLEIGGHALPESLPVGSPIEVTLEVDRGGRLSASALIPRLDLSFQEVAHLVVPQATPEGLAGQLDSLRLRLESLRAQAMRAQNTVLQDHLYDIEWSLQDAQNATESARGGDQDAAQRAQRVLLEVDHTLDQAEESLSWPELEANAVQAVASASRWVNSFGTPQEQQLLQEASAAVQRARVARQPVELQRQVRVVRQLGTGAYYRHPDAWKWNFQHAAADVSNCSDLEAAQRLVQEGRAYEQRNDTAGLRRVTQALWKLLPANTTDRALGHDSGLR